MLGCVQEGSGLMPLPLRDCGVTGQVAPEAMGPGGVRSGLRKLVPTTRGLPEGSVPHVPLSWQFCFKASVHGSPCVPCAETDDST